MSQLSQSVSSFPPQADSKSALGGDDNPALTALVSLIGALNLSHADRETVVQALHGNASTQAGMPSASVNDSFPSTPPVVALISSFAATSLGDEATLTPSNTAKAGAHTALAAPVISGWQCDTRAETPPKLVVSGILVLVAHKTLHVFQLNEDDVRNKTLISAKLKAKYRKHESPKSQKVLSPAESDTRSTTPSAQEASCSSIIDDSLEPQEHLDNFLMGIPGREVLEHLYQNFIEMESLDAIRGAITGLEVIIKAFHKREDDYLQKYRANLYCSAIVPDGTLEEMYNKVSAVINHVHERLEQEYVIPSLPVPGTDVPNMLWLQMAPPCWTSKEQEEFIEPWYEQYQKIHSSRQERYGTFFDSLNKAWFEKFPEWLVYFPESTSMASLLLEDQKYVATCVKRCKKNIFRSSKLSQKSRGEAADVFKKVLNCVTEKKNPPSAPTRSWRPTQSYFLKIVKRWLENGWV
ncbi:hypothetical protein PAXRUDRAFT_28787 [Paxillus rubicundulus Ve08.2h10]|uniref:Uncharacterized protein n=1 Tax=Paxillus rubicundulus Ve08.2h10 TaxID=930991 RepID=A0A0D0DHP1_9AGAM|nr:hypothetical protein PAXRUDRAFT_28787 [Paxillus rubicundulus Ve08.2h10]